MLVMDHVQFILKSMERFPLDQDYCEGISVTAIATTTTRVITTTFLATLVMRFAKLCRKTVIGSWEDGRWEERNAFKGLLMTNIYWGWW